MGGKSIVRAIEYQMYLLKLCPGGLFAFQAGSKNANYSDEVDIAF